MEQGPADGEGGGGGGVIPTQNTGVVQQMEDS